MTTEYGSSSSIMYQVGGTVGKIDHVRTTDTSKTQLILSKEDLDTRSLEVQRSSADIYVTGGSHETDAFFFGDSGSYDEVRGEGADRVVGPVGRRGHRPGQHATSHARCGSALVEPAHGQVQHFLAGPLYGPTDFYHSRTLAFPNALSF